MKRTHRVNCRSIASTRVAFTGYGNGFAAAAALFPGRSRLVCVLCRRFPCPAAATSPGATSSATATTKQRRSRARDGTAMVWSSRGGGGLWPVVTAELAACNN